MQLQDYVTQVQSLVRDASQSDFPVSLLTQFINNARMRVAMDTHCVRNFYTGLNVIPGQETYSFNGTVGGIKVTAGGHGYTPATTVTLTGGSPTTSATATPVISNGVITGINMTSWGAGYQTAPTVVIADTGGGTAASATPVTLLNVLDLITSATIFSTLRTTMRWCPFSTFQTFFRFNTTVQQQPMVWSVLQQTQTVYVNPIPDQAYPMEWDSVGLPTSNLVSLTDYETSIPTPWTDCVQYYAAYLCYSNLQNLEMAGRYYSPEGKGYYPARVRQMFSSTVTPRVVNPYATGLPMIRSM